MKKEMFQKLRNLFNGSGNDANETAKQEVSNIENYFEGMADRIGESYASVLDSFRKNPVQVKQFEGFTPVSITTDTILDKIVIREELTLEDMFKDVSTMLSDQLSMTNELTKYYNSVIEKLQADHLSDIATIQDQVTGFQEQASTLREQVSTLQDQLKAGPTKVEGIDPQLQITTAEESFGKQLLHQMPEALKEKIQK